MARSTLPPPFQVRFFLCPAPGLHLPVRMRGAASAARGRRAFFFGGARAGVRPSKTLILAQNGACCRRERRNSLGARCAALGLPRAHTSRALPSRVPDQKHTIKFRPELNQRSQHRYPRRPATVNPSRKNLFFSEKYFVTYIYIIFGCRICHSRLRKAH